MNWISIMLGVLVLCLPASVLGWSSPGHMTIAAIAYRELPTQSQARVTELLQHHPNYDKWAASYVTNSPTDLPTFIFMRASTWPDEIRRKGNPHDHPQWHYVNYPLIPPNFPDNPRPFPTNDIIFGIKQCEKLIKEKSVSLEVRAVYLSWLIHLVGDIHQPLHCVSLVNSNYPAPQGDKGGNGFYVRPNTAGVALHSIWDQGLGSTSNPRQQYNEAIRISAAHPRKHMSSLSRYKTSESWGQEGRQLALESVYLNGKLAGSTQAKDAPPLPQGYTQNLKQIAEKQAALAGYRLADEIKRYLP
jgi:hypothetical protein